MLIHAAKGSGDWTSQPVPTQRGEADGDFENLNGKEAIEAEAQ